MGRLYFEDAEEADEEKRGRLSLARCTCARKKRKPRKLKKLRELQESTDAWKVGDVGEFRAGETPTRDAAPPKEGQEATACGWWGSPRVRYGGLSWSGKLPRRARRIGAQNTQSTRVQKNRRLRAASTEVPSTTDSGGSDSAVTSSSYLHTGTHPRHQRRESPSRNISHLSISISISISISFHFHHISPTTTNPMEFSRYPRATSHVSTFSSRTTLSILYWLV